MPIIFSYNLTESLSFEPLVPTNYFILKIVKAIAVNLFINSNTKKGFYQNKCQKKNIPNDFSIRTLIDYEALGNLGLKAC